MKSLMLIMNARAAADPELREAVHALRSRGHRVDVRPTWEHGDGERAAEGAAPNHDLLIAAGGDGTLNEVVNGLMKVRGRARAAVGILPYGTANDFATQQGIEPGDPLTALRTLIEREPSSVDLGRVNERWFVNVATGGYAAEVTASTSPNLKRELGGLAYLLTGVWNFSGLAGTKVTLRADDGYEREGRFVALCIGNGWAAGGGITVCPEANLQDGVIDVMAIPEFPAARLPKIVREVFQLGRWRDYEEVDYFKTTSLIMEAPEGLHLNVDGEPLRNNRFQITVEPEALPLVLPGDVCSAPPLPSRAEN